MKTFTVCTRTSLYIQIAVLLTFGAIPLIITVNRGGGPAFLIFCAACFLGLWFTMRSVHTIRVDNDGTIQFERLLGTIQVNVRDITLLEGFRKNEYDGMVWKMRVRYRGHSITTPFFAGVPDFIAAVRALEPRVRFQGEWPTLDPWGRSA